MRSAFVVPKPRLEALRGLNYTPEIERFRANTVRPSRPLGTLITQMGAAYGAVFTRIDCAPEHGVELVTQSDMFASEPAGRVIRVDSMARPERHRIDRWQVLIAGAGTLGESELYGRAIIADSRLEGRFVGPHAMVLTFEEPGSDENLYTYAFLLTKIGLRAIRATSFGTKILGLRKDLLRELPIPSAPGPTRTRVANLVRKAVEQREIFVSELRAARAVIERLPAMQEAYAACAERKARVTVWDGPLRTLCAWNVASVGDALGGLQRRWHGRLADLVAPEGIFYGPRFARVPCDRPHGLDFMSQRDLFLVRPIPRRIAHPGFSDAKLFVPRDTLLVGAQGTLGEGEIFGRTVLVRGRLEQMAYTQHLLRVIPHAGSGAVLYAYLSTLVGMRLLRATGVGTKLLSMREDLLRELPMPDLSEKERKVITLHVEAAYRAREGAESSETEAIRIIEEEVMPAWLD